MNFFQLQIALKAPVTVNSIPCSIFALTILQKDNEQHRFRLGCPLQVIFQRESIAINCLPAVYFIIKVLVFTSLAPILVWFRKSLEDTICLP